ncbi:MAG: hypothetical protein GC162_09775 [Planctomycetes bacterium]|nr:hypothetical protein [Planctomycetota bacterium]
MRVELARTIRFCLAADGSLDVDAEVSNSFAAWPPMRGLGRYYELTVTCVGDADRDTGYFMNIKRIDEAARTHALPAISAAAKRADAPLGRLMATMISMLGASGGPLDRTVVKVELRLTPTVSIGIEVSDMTHVLVSQQFEFAAAHRLHTPALSDTENREVFGKCNNPAGHGHNYRVEVTVRSPIDAAGHAIEVGALDKLVDVAVIEKLDHKHLNVDVPQFASLNPSVEHIAKVVYDMLESPVAKRGVKLEQVRVWETSKTVCTYRPGI